jgi:hypothetical protein
MTKKLFETPSANKKKLLKYSILNLRENLNGLKKKSEFYLQQNQNFLIQRENGKKLKKKFQINLSINAGKNIINIRIKLTLNKML